MFKTLAIQPENGFFKMGTCLLHAGIRAKYKRIWIPDYDIRGPAPDNRLLPLSFILYQTWPECSMII